MKPETLALLCRPGTHEPLRLSTETRAGGGIEEALIGVDSGDRFIIRDGIPILVDEASVQTFSQRYRRLYNRVASVYDAAIRLAARIGGAEEGTFRRQYLERLAIEDGDRMLEVSIGTGANVRFLAAMPEVFGLDLSWAMLQRCRRNLRHWGREAELILGNAEELPLRDETFDSVLHVGGINAFDDRARAIGEMVRVARAGTRIVIVDETATLMERLAWMPGARAWLTEHGDRFEAPVALVPEGMRDIEVVEIAKGNLYCLAFTKP